MGMHMGLKFLPFCYMVPSTFAGPKCEEELKRLLMKVKEKSEKAGLKPSVQKTKIMASGPITSWQIDGETVERETLFLGASESLQLVTAAMKLKDACSLEEKL